jgi:hypothetical protein
MPFGADGHHIAPGSPKPAYENIDRLCRRLQADVDLCVKLGETFRDEGEHYFQGIMVGAAIGLTMAERSLAVIDRHLNPKHNQEVGSGVRQDQKHDPPEQGEVQSLW